MLEIRKSDTYEQWLRKLKDRQAQVRINARIRRVEKSGNLGDAMTQCIAFRWVGDPWPLQAPDPAQWPGNAIVCQCNEVSLLPLTPRFRRARRRSTRSVGLAGRAAVADRCGRKSWTISRK